MRTRASMVRRMIVFRVNLRKPKETRGSRRGDPCSVLSEVSLCFSTLHANLRIEENRQKAIRIRAAKRWKDRMSQFCPIPASHEVRSADY